MPKFRTGTRKDGSTYHYPVAGKGSGSQSIPSIETVRVKEYGRFGQRDIEYAKDILPNVDEDKDFGWLPALERDVEREFDQKDRERLSIIFKEIRDGSPEQSAISLTELGNEYPEVYFHYMGSAPP